MRNASPVSYMDDANSEGRKKRGLTNDWDSQLAALSDHVKKGNLDGARNAITSLEGTAKSSPYDDAKWKKDRNKWLQKDSHGLGASVDDAVIVVEDKPEEGGDEDGAAVVREWNAILTLSNALHYGKTNAVHAFRTDTPIQFHKTWGISEAKAGDYCVANADGDLYANTAEEFKANYSPAIGEADAMYRKSGFILAKCLPHSFRLIWNGEEKGTGKPTDFVVQSENGKKQYVVSAVEFRATYSAVSPLIVDDTIALRTQTVGAVDILKSVDDEVWDFMRRHVSEWDVDFFQLARMTSSRCPLFILAHHLFFERLSLVSDLGVHPTLFAAFLAEIDNTYLPVGFHSSLHGADVLHGVFYICDSSTVGTALPAAERFCFLIAAMCHDLAHPGTTSGFQTDSGAPIADKYNQCSVLENFHIGLTFRILAKEVYSGMLPSSEILDPRLLRYIVIQNILATDLAESGRYFREWDRGVLGSVRAAGNEQLTLPKQSDRILWMQMALKCSDISHPTKVRALHLRWSDMIREEFKEQAEKEDLLGIPHRFQLSDDPVSIAKSMAGYIRFIVIPCWSRFCLHIGGEQGPYWMGRLAEQEACWNEIIARQTPETPK